MLRMKRRILQIVVIAVVAFAMLGAQSDQRARYTKLGHALMCECGCGQILLECNHVGCTVSDKMAKQLRAMIDKGQTDDQIKDAFVQEYGVIVLAAPTNKGFDRVAWIMPFVVFGLGMLAVVWVVKTWKSRQAATAVIANAAPEEMDEMKRRAREETEV
jgi:cytochrome c-type biogenesis protein CcmH/NrfF